MLEPIGTLDLQLSQSSSLLRLKMIALLEHFTVALENIDQILVGKVFLSSTLKTLLYLTFTTKVALWHSYAVTSVPIFMH